MEFGTEINNIINNLCNKFGVSVNYLIPKLAEYKTITSAYMFCVWFIITIFSFIISLAVKGKGEDGKLEYAFDAGRATLFLILFTFSIFSFIMMLKFGYDFIGWKFAPEAKTIEYVLNLIKKSN